MNRRSSVNQYYVHNREQAVRNMARLRRALFQRPQEVTPLPGESDRYLVLRSDAGELLVSDPMDENFGLSRHPPQEGLARVACSFDAHSFYYTEVVVHSMEELLELIDLHVRLERAQSGRSGSATVHVSADDRSHRYLPRRHNRQQAGWGFTVIRDS